MYFDLFSEVLWNPWDRTVEPCLILEMKNTRRSFVLAGGRAACMLNTLQAGEEWNATQELFACRSLVIAGNLEQVGCEEKDERLKKRWEEKDGRQKKRWEEKDEREAAMASVNEEKDKRLKTRREEKDERQKKRWDEEGERLKKRWKEIDEKEAAIASMNETYSDTQKAENWSMGMIGVTGTLITGLLVLRPVHKVASSVVALGAWVFYLNAFMLLLATIGLDTIPRGILWIIRLLFVAEGWEARHLRRGIIFIHRLASIVLLVGYIIVVTAAYEDVERKLEGHKKDGASAP